MPKLSVRRPLSSRSDRLPSSKSDRLLASRSDRPDRRDRADRPLPPRPGGHKSLALAWICLLIASASALAASSSGSYSGRTSQKRPISFQISGGAVRKFRYRIDDRCPGGKQLIVRAWGFPALRIKQHRFGGTFVAKAPASARAVIAGTVSGKTVHGTLYDRTRNRTTHRYCVGRAKFSLRRHSRASET